MQPKTQAKVRAAFIGEAKTYQVCQVCGYVTDKKVLKQCPVCGAQPEKFKTVEP
jgi:rubredoxin